MKTELVRRLTPEEEELAAKRDELAQLEAQLADEELALASLKAELAGFEGLYLRRVGILYAELDEWTARTSRNSKSRSSATWATICDLPTPHAPQMCRGTRSPISA